MADLQHVSDYFMHFKDQRFKSFKDWPFDDGKCSAEKDKCPIVFVMSRTLSYSLPDECEALLNYNLSQLAEAGFYHIPSDQSPDATRCFACYKELDGWEPNDDPWSEHKKHSPTCPFLRRGIPVEQMTVQDLLKLEIKRQVYKMSKLFDAKTKELKIQSEAVREEMEAFL